MDETKQISSPILDLKNIESMNTSLLVQYCKKYRERVALFKNPEDIKILQSINYVLDKRIVSPSTLLFQTTTPAQSNGKLSSTPSIASIRHSFSLKYTPTDQLVTPLKTSLSPTTLSSPISLDGGRLDEPTISCDDPPSAVYTRPTDKNGISLETDCSSESLSFLHSDASDQKLKGTLLSFRLPKECFPSPNFTSKKGTTSAGQLGEINLVFAEREDEEYLEVVCPSNPIEIPKLVIRKRARKTIPNALVEGGLEKRRCTESPSTGKSL